jgi:5-methylcytosine-specific restriction protein A
VKAGGPLQRYTPLTSTTPLPRSTIGRNQGPKTSAKRPRNTGPTASVLKILARRSEGLCEFWQCLNEGIQNHHRRPRRMGGSSDPATNQASNLIKLCLHHHSFAESHRTKALELGLLLHASADPLRAPALLRYGTVLLDNDGSWTDINDNPHTA